MEGFAPASARSVGWSRVAGGWIFSAGRASTPGSAQGTPAAAAASARGWVFRWAGQVSDLRPVQRTELAKITRKERIDVRIHALSVEDKVGAQMTFTLEAGSLQDALRRPVVGCDQRFDARNTCFAERPTGEQGDRAGREATSTGTLDDPVADPEIPSLGSDHEHDRPECLARG